MKKKILLVLLILLFQHVFAHHEHGPAKYYVIIDTDAALDDLRAINILLAARKDVEILAITTSDGILSPTEGLLKIRSLLNKLGHQGIPTAASKVTIKRPPVHRDFARQIQWGNEQNINTEDKKNAVDLTISAIENEKEKVIYISFGSLTNLSAAITKKPAIKDKIERVIWYNDAIHPASGTNYDFDKDAAEKILNSNLHIDVINNLNDKALVFDSEYLTSIANIHTPYTKAIVEAYDNEQVKELMQKGQLKIWDDLLPVYLLFPGLFEMQSFSQYPHHKINISLHAELIKEKIIQILSCQNHDEGVLLRNFPQEDKYYKADVILVKNQIIKNHGKEEWRLCVITSEFHTHLGIYSIIGAKMGLRAREYFNIDSDNLQVVSYAGSKPPLSCMNDGLQVSTGATLGHGTITISEDTLYPEAKFIFKNRIIVISLKPEYWEIIQHVLERGVEQYGAGTEENWNYVRRNGINFWLMFDRYQIFEIMEINYLNNE